MVQTLQGSQVTGSWPFKIDYAYLINNVCYVSLRRNPLQKFQREYNKNETCDTLLLNETLKGKHVGAMMLKDI